MQQNEHEQRMMEARLRMDALERQLQEAKKSELQALSIAESRGSQLIMKNNEISQLQEKLGHELSFCQRLQRELLEKTRIIAKLQEQLIVADYASQPAPSGAHRLHSTFSVLNGPFEAKTRGQSVNKVAHNSSTHQDVMRRKTYPFVQVQPAQKNTAVVTPPPRKRMSPMTRKSTLPERLCFRTVAADSNNSSSDDSMHDIVFKSSVATTQNQPRALFSQSIVPLHSYLRH